MNENDEKEEGQEQRAIIALDGFERIRRVIFEGHEYWSVVDVVGYLTEAANPSKYWNTLRGRLVSEGARETLSQIYARDAISDKTVLHHDSESWSTKTYGGSRKNHLGTRIKSRRN